MADFFTDVWKSIVGFLGSFNWIVDTLDILLVAFIIYSAIKLVRDSRAEQLLKGIILLLVMFGVAKLLHMKALDFLLQTVFNSSLLLLAIIFQPEIRRALEQAGHSRLGPVSYTHLDVYKRQAVHGAGPGASGLLHL